MVDVGPLLSVHFDGNESLIEQLRHLRVLEGLMRHDMAPVAGGISNGKEDGLILLPCSAEGLVTPGVPLNGIPCMLEEIGTLLFDQTVTGHIFCHEDSLWKNDGRRSRPTHN